MEPLQSTKDFFADFKKRYENRNIPLSVPKVYTKDQIIRMNDCNPLWNNCVRITRDSELYTLRGTDNVNSRMEKIYDAIPK